MDHQQTLNVISGKTEAHLAKSGEFAGMLHAEATEAFEDLVSRAAQAGFDLRIISGFRGFDRQLRIWNAKARGDRPVLNDEEAEIDLSQLSDLEKVQAIMRFSALPGSSRHHWGTDVDVYDASAVDAEYKVQLTCSETVGKGPFAELHQWLDSELPNTDFFRPYERDTGGVSVEPWHLSYRPLATEYEHKLDAKALLESYQGVEIALIDSIKANIDMLFDRFIKVTE